MTVVMNELKDVACKYKKLMGYNHYLNEISLEEAISNELEKSSYVKDYTIEANEIFDSPGYACGYVCVAWVEIDNSLYSQVYEWNTSD